MGKRISQVNELIHQTLGGIFLRELDLPVGTILTVKRVETAADCKDATVWVSVLPEDRRDATLGLLEQNLNRLQRILFKALVMEHPPRITFKLDVSEGQADRVLRLLDKLDDPQ